MRWTLLGVSVTRIFFELKEMAKWSRDPEEKKTAIKELSAHGEKALTQLEEILNVTAFEDIKTACIEAIKAIRADRREVSAAEADASAGTGTRTSIMTTKSQKKEEEEESASETGIKLADLPP